MDFETLSRPIAKHSSDHAALREKPAPADLRIDKSWHPPARVRLDRRLSNKKPKGQTKPKISGS
jgi:hypothetical protein